MPVKIKGPLSIALGALATTTLGGCYYGEVYGASYASGGDCAARYGNAYYDYDGYAYDDGYGYDCYDASDYGGGFVQIGFGGGWYDDYYYPGHGLWMFDRYRNRYPLRDRYLNYWGGRRAWWKHHGGRGPGQPGRPGGWTRGDGDGRPGDARPGGWQRGDRDRDGPRGTRPGRNDDNPPAANRPDRPDRGPGGWQRGDRGNEGRRGTRPGGRPQGSIETAPPATADPARPARERFRTRPTPQDGSAVTRPRPIRSEPSVSGSTDNVAPPRTGSEMRRGPRNPAPSAMPGGAPQAERPAPAFRQPSAAPVRSTPVPVAVPESRPVRADPPARGNREDNVSPE